MPASFEDRPVGHRADIQGLRALAVLAVVANHMADWPAGSFVGVDVFFVISGYLITGLLVREFESGGTISLPGFYVRRIKRILPAGLFVIGTTVAAARVLAGIDSYRSTVADSLAAVLFSANWHFAQTGVNYFNQFLPPSPLQHYWSLSVEEQFYVVWPGLMLALMLVGPRLRVWPRAQTRLVCGVAIAALSAGSLAGAFAQTAHHPTAAYFSTFVRAWELGTGALVAITAGRTARWSASTRRTVAVLGLVGVVCSFFLVRSSSGFPAPWALLPTLSAAAILGADARPGGRWLAPLSNPASQYLGKISYSLYLWHLAVVALIAAVVPRGSVLYWSAGLALIFGLSAASFRWLEEPARRGHWFRARPGGFSVPASGWLRYTGALALFAFVGAAGFRAVSAGRPTKLALGPAVMVGHTADNPRNCLGAAALDVRHHCLRLNQGDRVAPLPGELPDDTGGAYDCYAYVRQPAHPCDYGSARPDAVRVALVGDSHAAALLAALQPQLVSLNWRVTAFTGQGCGWQPPALAPECPGLAQIQRSLLDRHFPVVIATGIRLFSSSVADHLKSMKPVAAAGARILVVEDDPSVSAASTECVNRIDYRATGGCGTPAALAYRVPDRLAQAADRIAGARVVKTRAFYCRGEFCPATIGNVLVYRDGAAHVTASYARTVSPYLVQAVERALPATLR